ncbi:MAG: cobalamin-binding protein [Gallionellaceae bacterium]
MKHLPGRIVCMSTETTEVLYLLGEQSRIVGISGFTVRPPEARREKPKVSAFTSAKIDQILALQPDLVLGFSNLQADMAAELVRAGIAVHIFNQRSIAEILSMIALVGAMVGKAQEAQQLIMHYQQQMDDIRAQTASYSKRPRIYFEEWDEPQICGIRWVSELIELAGGIDCFADIAVQSSAKQRIVSAEEVVRQQPDIIIASWCGKKFRAQHMRQRPGWESIPAIANDQLFEIKSADILQPGPAALTDGLKQLRAIVARWQENHGA